MFSCTTAKGKPVEVCQAADTVNYRFAQEMEVKVPTGDLKWQRDSGTGGGSDDLHFPNGSTIYQVNIASYWDSGSAEEGAAVYVNQPGKKPVEIACKAGTVQYKSEALKAEPRGYFD